MKQAASTKANLSERSCEHALTCGPGISFAEWRYEISAGNRAFACGDHKNAALHFASAVGVAERLAAIAGLGGADADCAVKALIAARRNVAENFLRMGLVEDAGDALEELFLQVCAVARSSNSDLQNACARRISDVTDVLLAHLERSFASASRLLMVQTIADETIISLRKGEGGITYTEVPMRSGIHS